MNKQPAKVLEPVDVRRVLKHVQTTRYPLRNRAIVLLSFKAGLRACEIAGLTWQMVLASDGKLDRALSVSRDIAKQGHARRIPTHPELRRALKVLHRHHSRPLQGAVVRSERGQGMTPRSIVNWFAVTYATLDLEGCSSHSGRRTFITQSARLIHRTGGSLRDVQELAGHRALTTTERYIEGNRDAQRQLMKLL